MIITSVPKFYFFDTGVVNTLSKKRITQLKGFDAGKSFETYIMHELHAYRSIFEKDYSIFYWRTKTGLEVDFVIPEKKVGIEVKISQTIEKTDLKGLLAFMEEQDFYKSYVVCNIEKIRKIEIDQKEIWVFPIHTFLEKLWHGDIL